VQPTAAELADDHLLMITWADGSVLHYPTDHLRAYCPCASCTGGAVGRTPLAKGQFAGIALKSLKQIGAYAFQIGFDDGHALGIYSFDLLRKIGFPPGEAPPTSRKPPTTFEV
jgi:DUF971 family protein